MPPVEQFTVQAGAIEFDHVGDPETPGLAIRVNAPYWIERIVSKRVSDRTRNLVSIRHLGVRMRFRLRDCCPDRFEGGRSHEKSGTSLEIPRSKICFLSGDRNLGIVDDVLSVRPLNWKVQRLLAHRDRQANCRRKTELRFGSPEMPQVGLACVHQHLAGHFSAPIRQVFQRISLPATEEQTLASKTKFAWSVPRRGPTFVRAIYDPTNSLVPPNRRREKRKLNRHCRR